MAAENIVSMAAATAAGGLTVTWVAKTLIQNYLSNNNDTAKAVQGMAVEMGSLKTEVSHLKDSDEKLREEVRQATVKMDVMKEQISLLSMDVRRSHKQ